MNSRMVSRIRSKDGDGRLGREVVDGLLVSFRIPRCADSGVGLELGRHVLVHSLDVLREVLANGSPLVRSARDGDVADDAATPVIN